MQKRWFPMNKKAQFFLIAALIISGIILSFGKSYTSSKVEATPVEVYDLSNQLQYEASQVIDNGLLENAPMAVIQQDLQNLTSYYAAINPDSNIDVIYGNDTALNLISYSMLSGGNQNITVTPLDIPAINAQTTATTDTKDILITRDISNINIKLTIDKGTEKEKVVNNKFEIKSGQNLYIIVRKKVKDQDVVIYR